MRNIDTMSCVEKLQSGGAAYRLNGIITCLDKKEASAEEIKALRALKDDQVILAGRMISDYAIAVLDVLGIDPYEGDKRQIVDLITAWVNE